MNRKGNIDHYTSTDILSTSEKYSKYSFWLLFLILLLMLGIITFCYMKGGIPVRVRA